MAGVFDVQGMSRRRIRSGEVGLPPDETRGGGLPLSAAGVEKKRMKKKGQMMLGSSQNAMDMVKNMSTSSLRKSQY